MDYVLDNGTLRAKVKSLGAELSSLVDLRDGVEHMWQADPEVWKRHAPVLFPIVGQVKNGTYRVGGKEYHLSQHGFARDQEFDLVSQSETHLTFRLQESKASLEKFPYRFTFQITYELAGQRLWIRYSIENPSSDLIHFSLGAHPGFTCPFSAEQAFEDFELKFETSETADLHLFAEGLRSGQKKTNFLKSTDVISLSHKLFDGDALIFHNLQSKSIQLRPKTGGKFLEMGLEGFPWLGIWSKPGAGAPFVCIEPWYGVADEQNFDGEFKDKAGVQELAPGETFEATTYVKLGQE